MNAAKQAGWLFFSLILLASSGWYFASSSPVARLDGKVLAKTADLVITNLTVKRFDETGKLVNFLQTPQVEHIPDNNIHLFKTPRMMLIQPNQPPWEISSTQARSSHGGEQITFIKNVVIHQNKDAKNQESTVRTEKLDYFPKNKLASTDLPVRLEQPGRIIQAIGMNVYLEEKRVQLGQTRATFEPKHA